MNKVQHYINQIRAHYPQLDIVSAEINRDGQYNDVLVINKRLIFRFAKVPSAIETLRREVALLHHLQDQVPLSIPNPSYVHIDTDVIGAAFVGYPMIPGIPLWRENFQAISNPEVRRRMALQLATFLKELHQVSIEGLGVGLQIEDRPAYWIELYAQIQQKLYPYMRSDARQEIRAHFEGFFANKARFEFKPTLRHGDFGTGNILYDAGSESIAGVIDFGGAGLGDPAGDFAGLLISFGEAFYRNCTAVYPEMEVALQRVKFYCGTFALQEALFGYDNNDQSAFRAGMESYL